MADERTNDLWLRDLGGEPSPAALMDLQERLIRGLRYGLKQRYHVTELDIEDFVQDALLKILDNLDTFRGESKFTTWAQKIAIREAFSELRRKRWENVSLQDLVPDSSENDTSNASPLGWMPSDQVSPEQDITQQSLRALLARLIQEELTELQRTAMIAVFLRGMPPEEVARRMDSNRNALYKLLHDARKRLKERLEAQDVTVEEFMAAFSPER
ncbi:MAG: RNA polymerase sigma factor [Anaerolineae bacterium]